MCPSKIHCLNSVRPWTNIYIPDSFPTQIPILLDLNRSASHIFPPKPFHITDWEKFEEILNSTPFPLLNISLPQAIVSEISKIIFATIFNCTSVFTPPNPKQDVFQNVFREISRKRRLHSKWERTRDPIIKTRLNGQTLFVRTFILPIARRTGSTSLAHLNPT